MLLLGRVLVRLLLGLSALLLLVPGAACIVVLGVFLRLILVLLFLLVLLLFALLGVLSLLLWRIPLLGFLLFLRCLWRSLVEGILAYCRALRLHNRCNSELILVNFLLFLLLILFVLLVFGFGHLRQPFNRLRFIFLLVLFLIFFVLLFPFHHAQDVGLERIVDLADSLALSLIDALHLSTELLELLVKYIKVYPVCLFSRSPDGYLLFRRLSFPLSSELRQIFKIIEGLLFLVKDIVKQPELVFFHILIEFVFAEHYLLKLDDASVI